MHEIGDDEHGRPWVRIAVAIVAAVPALMAAGAALWNDVLKSGAAPTKIKAHIGNIALYPGRTLRVYLDSHPGQLALVRDKLRTNGLTSQEIDRTLRTDGVLAEFTLLSEGERGTPLAVTCVLYHAVTDIRVPDSPVTTGCPSLESRAESYESSRTAWIAAPTTRGRYYFEVDVLEPNGETLKTRRSADFRVGR
jgi:hypothetical protein